jgi:hypothetical protein
MPRAISRSVRQKLRKPIIKPVGWFGQPDLVNDIISILLTANGDKRNRCWKWLESEKPDVDGLPAIKGLPINMLDAIEEAEIVLAHAKAYAEYLKREK